MPEERSRALSPEKRIRTFEEVHLGLTRGEAIENAKIFLERESSVKGLPCPLGTDHFAVLRLLAKGDLAGAHAKLLETNPLPGVTGRLVPEPFDGVQAYNRKGERVSLRAIERFLADAVRPSRPPEVAHRAKQKVAVVGSGLAGLTAASVLSRAGHPVTVFESSHVLGGTAAYAYGEFVLPEKAVAAVIEQIRLDGVEFIPNTIVGRSLLIEEILEDRGYPAILLATGAGPARSLGVSGESSAGIFGADEAMKLLRWMKAGQPQFTTPDFLGQKVVVVGGSEIGLAVARTAVRLGKEALLIVRGPEGEIKSSAQQVKEAAEEGVKFKTFSNPVRIKTDSSGCVEALVCRHTDFKLNAQGQLALVEDGEIEFEVEADTLINASAQGAATLFLKNVPGLELTADGAVALKGRTSEATLRKVFAAGQVVDPGLSVLGLILAGKAAVADIQRSFQS
ncbi:MAG: FAD-dependent oxidoreductase [Candidatus Omnitrophica bacterium]|nr:FAD-dependent oxidoreductase [Candidatus Omnitrophota bacterium]